MTTRTFLFPFDPPFFRFPDKNPTSEVIPFANKMLIIFRSLSIDRPVYFQSSNYTRPGTFSRQLQITNSTVGPNNNAMPAPSGTVVRLP